MGQSCSAGSGARSSVEESADIPKNTETKSTVTEGKPRSLNFKIAGARYRAVSNPAHSLPRYSSSYLHSKAGAFSRRSSNPVQPLWTDRSTNNLMGSQKNLALSRISDTSGLMYTDMSMSNFEWGNQGCDGLELNKAKTREEIGMDALKAMDAIGADVKGLTTHGGRSALMVAVLNRDLDFVKRLVAYGANLEEETEKGETALTLAKSLPSQDIYNFLLQSSKR